MIQNLKIKAPFFEIGPKNYLWGDDVVELAKVADEASKKYDVDIIFTTPIVELRRVKDATERIHVFAPHMDSLTPGRGLADILPEALVAAHCGLQVVGISCITNMAAGISKTNLDHKEVQETADRVSEMFKKLVEKVIINM